MPSKMKTGLSYVVLAATLFIPQKILRHGIDTESFDQVSDLGHQHVFLIFFQNTLAHQAGAQAVEYRSLHIFKRWRVFAIFVVHDFFYHCLLYTSPSPRDRTRSRMPSSA